MKRKPLREFRYAAVYEGLRGEYFGGMMATDPLAPVSQHPHFRRVAKVRVTEIIKRKARRK